MRYAVFGLGNSAYASHFNKVGTRQISMLNYKDKFSQLIKFNTHTYTYACACELMHKLWYLINLLCYSLYLRIATHINPILVYRLSKFLLNTFFLNKINEYACYYLVSQGPGFVGFEFSLLSPGRTLWVELSHQDVYLLHIFKGIRQRMIKFRYVSILFNALPLMKSVKLLNSQLCLIAPVPQPHCFILQYNKFLSL